MSKGTRKKPLEGPRLSRRTKTFFSTLWNPLSKKRYFSEYRGELHHGEVRSNSLLKRQQGQDYSINSWALDMSVTDNKIVSHKPNQFLISNVI